MRRNSESGPLFLVLLIAGGLVFYFRQKIVQTGSSIVHSGSSFIQHVGSFVNTLTGAGLELIKSNEGYRSTPYQDSAGHWTAGWGHLMIGNELAFGGSYFDSNGYPISGSAGYTKSLEWLYSDTASAQNAVNTLVKVPLNSHQFDALVDFVYNEGAGALESSTLLSLLNQGHYAEAAGQLTRWDYAGGQVVAGLESRRLREQSLFLS